MAPGHLQEAPGGLFALAAAFSCSFQIQEKFKEAPKKVENTNTSAKLNSGQDEQPVPVQLLLHQASPAVQLWDWMMGFTCSQSPVLLFQRAAATFGLGVLLPSRHWSHWEKIKWRFNRQTSHVLFCFVRHKRQIERVGIRRK